MHKNIIVFFTLLVLLIPNFADAQSGANRNTGGGQSEIAEQPCDTGFWKQMEARAWLEAEREIMQNQSLIFKPDSVLDYTCFDQFNKIAAAQGGEIFVHTNYFGEKIIQREQKESTNQGLTAVVSVPLKGYISANYSHGSLGGRGPDLATTSGGPYDPQDPTNATNESYQCQRMSQVWQAAKCINFIDNSNFELMDGFYPFETLKGLNGEDVVGYTAQEDGGPAVDETRQYPTACNLTGRELKRWDSEVLKAENKFETFYKFQTPLGKIFKEVNDKIEPGKCSERGIETGVRVITKDGEKGMDGVCTNPGCTYTDGGACDGTVYGP